MRRTIMECVYCQKEYDNSSGLKNHQLRCGHNPNRVLQKPKNRELANLKLSEAAKKYYSIPGNKEKQSVIMRKTVLENPESYSDNNVVGRSKHFTIDGIRYNSTWEYEVALYLTENNIKWQRKNLKPLSYEWNGKWHLYFPDFLLIDHDIYIEVKGYETDRDRAKWNHSDKPMIVIKQKEIDKIKKMEYDILTEILSCSSNG